MAKITKFLFIFAILFIIAFHASNFNFILFFYFILPIFLAFFLIDIIKIQTYSLV